MKKQVLPLLLLCIFFSQCAQKDISVPPKGYLNQTTMKAAYAIGTLKLIEPKPEVPENIIVHKDLVYKTTSEKELKLDIYHQKQINAPTPLIIFIHGGSWKKGNKDDYRKYLVDYANKGYITATVAYRFSQESPFPAAFHDVVCAVKWLKENAANYNIDSQNIALVGGSAGGHLAMMVGYHSRDQNYQAECEVTTDTKVKAIVNLYGPANLTTDFATGHPTVHQFIGQPYKKEIKHLYDAASPLFFVSPDDPPTLTFHGTIDKIVPVVQSDMLHAALQKNNVPSEYHRLKGWPHTMDMGIKVNGYCQYHMDKFLEQYLRAPK